MAFLRALFEQTSRTAFPPSLAFGISRAVPAAAEACFAVIATLTKGYDLGYIWRQVDPDLTKDAAGYTTCCSASAKHQTAPS